MNYDSIIVGAGPAGLFAALELSRNGKKVAIIDAGVDINSKVCPIEQGNACKYCKPVCNIIGGFGGAQFFEGTKLSIYPAGTGIIDYCGSIIHTLNMYDYIDGILESFGKLPRKKTNIDEVKKLYDSFKDQEIEMKYYNSQKVSKSTMNKIVINIKDELESLGVDIFLKEQVYDLVKTDDDKFIVFTKDNEYFSDTVIFAVGRVGARQLVKLADSVGIEYENESQEIEVGLRVEMPYQVFKGIDNIHNDLKLKKRLNESEELRTFCQDYKGFITKCVYNLDGDSVISSLDGHIIGTDEEGGYLSDVVNLAVHHRFKVDLNIDKIYGMINAISINKKPIVQSMKNFMENSNDKNLFLNEFSMKDVCEGNINNFIPERTLTVLKEFIKDIDKVLPGFAADTNTVYAPSFEMGWKKFVLSKDLETTLDGVYIIGDVTGHFRGAMQSMASGVLVSNSILARE